MGFYEKPSEPQNASNTKKIKLLTICCIVLAVAVVILTALLLCGNSKNEAPVVLASDSATEAAQVPNESYATAQKELLIYEVEATNDDILIKTSYGDMRFPYSFSDIIRVDAVSNDTTKALEFSVDLADAVYPIYTISFTDPEGMCIGSLLLPEERKPYYVTVTLHAPDETLQGDDLLTFQAAQETFNDIWVSMMDNDGFTPIE